MHPNPIFRQEPRTRNLDFARERGFGTLIACGAEGPLLAHVPFVLDEAGTEAELHLLRSNPVARAAAAGPVPATIAVSGPDAYVSPDWYGVPDQVPTWNYIAVHLRGRLHPLPAGDMRGALDRLSERFEAALAPKRPWTAGKMPEETLARMMRSILPFRFEVTEIDGTWKLGQNKPAAARRSAAMAVDAYGIGQETRLIAALMRGLGESGPG